MVVALAATLVLGRAAAADSPYVVDVWGTEDGLPESTVITVAQGRDGYLWLGTYNGLVRFDGNSMTPINVNNTPALPDNFITFLFADSHTNLWVGTGNGGLCVIGHGTAKQFDIKEAGGKVVLADEDASGVVRFLTGGDRLFSITDGKMVLHQDQPQSDLPARYYHLSLSGKNGVQWQFVNSDKVGEVWKLRNGKPEWNVRYPWSYAPNDIPGTRSKYKFDANVTAFCEDRDGNLVVGTHDAGIYWFDANGNVDHILTDKGRSHDNVLSVCCDHEGNLWVGTDGDGLERISRKTYTDPLGFGPGVALSTAEDARGGIWAAFNRSGLTYVITNSSTSFKLSERNNPWAVFVDHRQQVWVGTRDEGLFLRHDDGSFAANPAAAPLGTQILAFLERHDGTLWIGGQNGLASFDGEQWTFLSQADGLPAGAVRALAEDANSNLWIGVENAGLYILRHGRVSPASAPVADISCLLYDRDHVLWVGTSGHGLARFADGSWTNCSSADGLTVDDIGYLIDDDFTNLWMGTYEGLLRADKQSLADFAAGKVKRISCHTFLTRECVGAQPAATRTHDGQLLFPTLEGLISVNPANLRPNTNPPPVVIESVLVDGVPQKAGPLASTWPDAIVLHPENQQLEIHFTALNFSAPKGVRFGARFRFQLAEPVEKINPKNWTDAGIERVAQFQKLPPGRYSFLVQACNEDGVWNETGASIAIVVEPPFWRKPGFIAASTLIFLGALAGAIYLVSTAKLKRQLRAAQQKELIEHERARIARDLHDQLGANLTQITLLGEMAETDKEIPAEIEQHAQQICATARDTTRSLDEIVWAVNPSNDTLESLANYACKYAQDYFAMAGVSYRAELPPGLPPVPILPEVRHNVFLAFKEAVNNVVKHAQATEARVKLQLEPGRFVLSVADNGRGLGDLSQKQLRNGLRNMRRRLSDVHGQFDLAPAAPTGTVVTLTVPVKN